MHSVLFPLAHTQHAEAAVARLEDDDYDVRREALETLNMLDPPALAQHAGAVVARLEDDDWDMRGAALETLGKLEPAALAQYAFALVARLKDSNWYVCQVALDTLCKLPEPATFRYQVYAVFAGLHVLWFRQVQARVPLRYMLPHFVTRGVDVDKVEHLRSRLLGRVAWYRFQLRRRVKCLALYWYALQYRPSGPGHARDVEKWEQMREMSMP